VVRHDRELDADVVELGPIRRDASDFRVRHEPGHPAADAGGNVRLPNVDPLIEQMDLREAQRSYEANLNVIGAARRMISKTIDLLKA
jgi:flagellar basal-body rod protein FlgC